MRVGILGGAFNPLHLGHLCLAQEAHARLGLDRVLLVPVGEAPHRVLAADPGASQRLRMVELAVAGDDRLAASSIEVDRPGPSYTVDTLRALAEHAPDDRLTLILGADQAMRLGEWQDPGGVLSLATLAVAERGGQGREQVASVLEGLAPADEIEAFPMPRIDVSSTLIRERLADGLPIRYLVPDAVAGHISEHGLYASGETGAQA